MNQDVNIEYSKVQIFSAKINLLSKQATTILLRKIQQILKYLMCQSLNCIFVKFNCFICIRLIFALNVFTIQCFILVFSEVQFIYNLQLMITETQFLLFLNSNFFNKLFKSSSNGICGRLSSIITFFLYVYINTTIRFNNTNNSLFCQTEQLFRQFITML